jgi:hypothetical protein
MLEEQDAEEREKERQKRLASLRNFAKLGANCQRANTVELLLRAAELERETLSRHSR